MKKKKIILFLSSITVLVLTFSITFGRYIYNYTKNYLLETKGFYFNSTTMNINGSSHSLSNWDGVNDYSITLDVNNRKNSHIHTELDITYDITYECSSNIICEISKLNGTILSDVETDSYIISFRPNWGYTFTSDDYAVVKTSVTSNFPYVKTMSTEYKVGIETLGFSYDIVDHEGDKYVLLELNNGLTFYQVQEAFLTYHVGDHISQTDYLDLSNENKLKCKSATVNIEIDTNDLRIDSLEDLYLYNAYNILKRNINGSDYVYKYSFDMDANSTKRIKIYKLDSSKNFNKNNYKVNVTVQLYN